MFENFVEQYKKYLCPLIEKTFGQEKVKGWFSPFIIKYENFYHTKTIKNSHGRE